MEHASVYGRRSAEYGNVNECAVDRALMMHSPQGYGPWRAAVYSP